VELSFFFQDFILQENMDPIEIPIFLSDMIISPNAKMILVTVASVEWSFFTMTQERLHALVVIVIESEMLEKIDYKDMFKISFHRTLREQSFPNELCNQHNI
jgi:hypothetical protein